ncbi:MAG: selenide, water dikinase SelD [Halioglobus sp.]
MQAQAEMQQDLVLVGGGHTHALVLRMLAMDPIAGLRITLISPASHTPYSGMLPGLVAGHYSFEQTHIDLARLCQWAGVRFIESEVIALDPENKRLSLVGRPAIEYDLVSLDIGSQPELDSVPGAREYSIPVKPVAGLWQRWRDLSPRLSEQDEPKKISVVGGGAGSVELALAMAHALAGRAVSITLVCGAPEVLSGYNRSARSAVMAALLRHEINVMLDSRVSTVQDGALTLADGSSHVFDELFWCTGASASPWVAASGLGCDARGFLQVTDALQSVDSDWVFGAGDIATQVNHPRPKAGVYAVRQAPVLAHNLRAKLLGEKLKQHKPQQRFLSLVSLGDRQAVADRGPFSATGNWVWRWKDRIDREFMGRFEDLPQMVESGKGDVIRGAFDTAGKPHCGGCGAKVGATGLSAVLMKLAADYPGLSLPPGEGDDASPIPGAGNGPLVQSLDVLRQMTADPWLMGRIAANHALSDLYACGAHPVSALAAITLPFARSSLLQRELEQILAGALHEFSQVGCALTGGHSMQGPELQVGFAVNGRAMQASGEFMPKRGAKPGDLLILTKPLGTGVLFAAHMQQLADGREIAAAVEMMLQSNVRAAALAVARGATACTDVTGFGLAGHLLEVLTDDQQATLHLESLPQLSGVAGHLAAGVRSTMHEANTASGLMSMNPALLSVVSGAEILFDPQTSGGLLIAVEAGEAAPLLEELFEAGCKHAAVIGEISLRPEGAPEAVIVS